MALKCIVEKRRRINHFKFSLKTTVDQNKNIMSLKNHCANQLLVNTNINFVIFLQEKVNFVVVCMCSTTSFLAVFVAFFAFYVCSESLFSDVFFTLFLKKDSKKTSFLFFEFNRTIEMNKKCIFYYVSFNSNGQVS